MEKEGWSDSIIGTGTIHYYKNGKSLCGRAVVNNGHKIFDDSTRDLNDRYSCHCLLCIKKQLS